MCTRTIYCLLPKSWWKPQRLLIQQSDLGWSGHSSNPFWCWVLLFLTLSIKLPALVEGLNKILVSLRLYFEVNILPGNASCLYHMPRITLHVEGVMLPEYVPWNHDMYHIFPVFFFFFLSPFLYVLPLSPLSLLFSSLLTLFIPPPSSFLSHFQGDDTA